MPWLYVVRGCIASRGSANSTSCLPHWHRYPAITTPGSWSPIALLLTRRPSRPRLSLALCAAMSILYRQGDVFIQNLALDREDRPEMKRVSWVSSLPAARKRGSGTPIDDAVYKIKPGWACWAGL